ncbi:hypothetical protein HK405_015600, partial [Cladochytrium tenue]
VHRSGSISSTGGPPDLFRHRNKRRDDAIRKKVEQEVLSRKTAASRRTSYGPSDPSRRLSRLGTVSSLRPAPAITVLESARIVQAAQLMAAKRADAVLAVNEDGQLSGILTDKDIAYRVVADGLDVRQTTVAQVMTRNPISVHDRGSRNEALNIMVARRFRHLPVIAANPDAIGGSSGFGNFNDNDDDDAVAGMRLRDASETSSSTGGGGAAGTNVVGLLDITKCVFERLDDLERKVNEDANIVAAMDALERRGAVDADRAGAIKAQHGCPDLHSVLARSSALEAAGADAVDDDDLLVYDAVPEVPVRASVRDAARVMKDFHHTAVLVVGAADADDKLAGIFTTKDIVLRVIAAGLDPAVTSVIRVM